jgi:hypothetical protein
VWKKLSVHALNLKEGFDFHLHDRESVENFGGGSQFQARSSGFLRQEMLFNKLCVDNRDKIAYCRESNILHSYQISRNTFNLNL